MRQAFHDQRALLIALSCLVVGCASSKSAQTGLVTPEAAQVEAPVPRDPVELVVGAPDVVLLTRASELRAAPLFERLRPYIERAACATLSEWDQLVRATTRALLATRAQGESEEWLLVLDGSYAEPDLDRLLRAAAARTPRTAPAAPIAVVSYGRFSISEDDVLAASLLERRLIVLGHKTWVRAALDSISHPAAKLSDLPLWKSVAPEVRCTEQALCVLSAANGSGARGLQHILASAGAKHLGQQLLAANSALALSLPSGAELGLHAQLPDQGAAEAAQRDLKDGLWQAGLLTRLAGLPDVLSEARVAVRGSALHVELSVSESDLARYEQRAGQLLSHALRDDCAASASPTAP
jgi:hypothetical protein